MGIEEIVVALALKFPVVGLVLAALGLLVVVGQVVVVLTPTKKDDEAVARWQAIPILGQILAILAKFAPIQKK